MRTALPLAVLFLSASAAAAQDYDAAPVISAQAEGGSAGVFRADFQPGREIAFHRVGGDWKRSDGAWRLTPIAGDKATHVTYEIHVAAPGPVPAGRVRGAVAKGAPEAMLALRRECVARFRNAAAKG